MSSLTIHVNNTLHNSTGPAYATAPFATPNTVNGWVGTVYGQPVCGTVQEIEPLMLNGTNPIGTIGYIRPAATANDYYSVGINGAVQQNFFTSVAYVDNAGITRTLKTVNATFSTTLLSGKSVWYWPIDTNGVTYNANSPVTFVTDPVFNCDCESVSIYDTLANVRTKMLVRLGYPNQSATPPPGMAALVDQHLRDAQAEVFRQLQRAALRTERFFRWTMVPGQRYYNLAAEELACSLLDPLKLTWVGFSDLNQAWYRLDEGIPPEYYTRANINFGWPTRYEIRSCIEIFPAPQAAYSLWIKGDFGLGPLVAGTDRFTIDDIAVYLLALGNMKADRGAKDAQLVLAQAGNYAKGLVAGAHGTRRYVPRSEVANPLTPPKFLPLG